MTLTGIVTAKADPTPTGGAGRRVTVRGANSLGDHVTGTVTVSLPARACAVSQHSFAGKVRSPASGDRVLEGLGPLGTAPAVEAVAGALADAGIAPQRWAAWSLQLGDQPRRRHRRSLGIGELTFFSRIHYGGGRRARHQQAALAVASGVADVVVCTGRSTSARGTLRAGVQDRAPMANAESAHFAFYMPVGLLTPPSGWPWPPALPACLGGDE